MNSQLKNKAGKAEKGKGKSATKTQEAAHKLAYLMTFNHSITQAVARAMQDG